MTEPPPRPVLVVSNVLVSQDIHVLLGLRKDCNLWETPGGKVERETVADAGRRELLEETGMTLLGEPVQLGFTDGFVYNQERGSDRWFVCLFMLWRAWTGFPKLVEGKHLKWKWFPLEKLPPADQLTQGTSLFAQNLLPALVQRIGLPAFLEGCAAGGD